MDFPATLLEFENTFSSEEKCVAYIVKLKWKEGFKCIKCNSNEYWLLSRNRIGCKKCGYKKSVLSGTIFEQTNKPLQLWFRVIWLMISQKNGVSAMGLKNIMGFGSYQTAWTWLHKLRRITVVPSRTKLSGCVELDETLVGGKEEGKRGRGAEGKVLVAIAIEVLVTGTGRLRLQVIPDATRKSLSDFIRKNVEKGSALITDGWRSYKNINEFTHTIIDQTISIDDDNLLPHAHRVASLLKRWLLGTHQQYLTGSKFQNYLDEFTFRYNRRKSLSRGLLFQRVMEQAVNHKPIKYNEIIKKAVK